MSSSKGREREKELRRRRKRREERIKNRIKEARAGRQEVVRFLRA